jgi:hypothetical protein
LGGEVKELNLTLRQGQIVEAIRLKSTPEDRIMIDKLLNLQFEVSDVENICSIINNEFMMEGILPNYEPNEYGVELESLLDMVNRIRIE